MRNKVISFAIPCYNSAEYMDNCIENLLKLNNDSDDIEIIIVDDGSQKDNTLEIAKSWENKFPSTIKAVHQENGGHGQAVNTGLNNASGLYFKVVDSDDYLDKNGTLPIMEYIRSQVKLAENNNSITDMVIGNYVYDRVDEGTRQSMNYKSALPTNQVFTWKDIKKFKPSQYLLMHSVVYRTQLLKDINLKLPKHTFYVDNIFVYKPLMYVKSMYYIDTDMYMYFIGRDDQSVNEEVMISRIDQQLRVTKIMVEATDYQNLNKQPNLCSYLINYLAMMVCISSTFLRLSGADDAEGKRRELLNFIEEYDPELKSVLMKKLVCFGANIPGKIGKGIGIAGYKLAQKLFSFN